MAGEFVKKQQCKQATRVQRCNSYSGQRWKLDSNMKLENKKGVWKSDDLWIFKPKDDDLIYINNTSKAVDSWNFTTKDDDWFASSLEQGLNYHYIWYHVMEHSANHMGQIATIKNRLPK